MNITFNSKPSNFSNIIRRGMDHVESRGVKILVDCKTTFFQLTKNIYTCYLKNKKCQWRIQRFLYSSSHKLQIVWIIQANRVLSCEYYEIFKNMFFL